MFKFPQRHPIELPPSCLFYIDPDLNPDSTYLTDWAGIYGISKPRDNLMPNYQMNADSNSDGVVDGFYKVLDAGITANFSLDQSSQKIDITASTGAGNALVSSGDIQVTSGETVSLSMIFKCSGTASPRIYVYWYNSSSGLISASSVSAVNNSASFATAVNENLVAPALTAKMQIKIGFRVNSAGQLSTGWFNTSVAVKGITATQIVDPHQNLTIIDKEAAAPYGIVRSLNGSTDYFYCDNHSNIDITNASVTKPLGVFSIFNVNPTAGNGFLVAKNYNSTSNVQYGFYYNATNKSIVPVLEGTPYSETSLNSVALGTWIIAGFIWDGSKVYAYINFTLKSGSVSSFAGTLTSRPYFSVGCRATGAFFKGLIGITFITYGGTIYDIKNWALKNKILDRYGIAA